MFQAFHLVDVRRKGTKDSLDDNGTQPGTLIEEDRIQNWGAAAGEPTQLHLVDEVSTMYQAQLTCVNSEQQPYCGKYSISILHLGKLRQREAWLTQVHTANEW